MPKLRRAKKDRNAPQPAAIRTPFKIGGRKSPKSALRMTTEELLQEYNRGGTRGRDRNKIRQVLQMRGVTDFTVVTEEAA